MVAALLGGFGNGSDTAFTNFERRDREMQIKLANQKRHDILYGSAEENKAVSAAAAAATAAAAAAAASSLSTAATPSESSPASA